MKHVVLGPFSQAAGTVLVPGSKSISNRALLLAALASGSTRLRGVLHSDDTRVMLDALATLGVRLDRGAEGVLTIEGIGGSFPVRSEQLFLGNAGTAMRPLTAALAILGGEYEIRGVARMHERPIGDLVDSLRSIGADIEYLGQPGYPPLRVGAGAVRIDGPISVRANVSSQFLSALLLALPLVDAREPIVVEVAGESISKPYVAMTVSLMERFGVGVAHEEWRRFTLANGQRYRSPGELLVEGDASSASYLLAAGAVGGGPVRVANVGRRSIQGDVRFVDALAEMGATIATGDDWLEVSGPPSGKLRGITLDCNHIPDAAMTLAVVALFAEGATTLTNIGSWRVKETDRIAAMATELRKLGATVDEGKDWIRVTPGRWSIADAGIDTYDDHRVAMSFALAAFGPNAVRINDPACVGKTFPDFFEVLARVAR